MLSGSLPSKQGLYNPENEHDACGVGFIAHIKGKASHEIVEQGLEILKNLVHRGAVGADPKAGDGAGILIQLPHQFFKETCSENGIELPKEGGYGIGTVFVPQNDDGVAQALIIETIERIIKEEHQTLAGWRTVPVDNACLGKSVLPTEPWLRQFFVIKNKEMDQDTFERKLFVIRKRIEGFLGTKGIKAGNGFYIPSLSSRVILYKGILLADQMGVYYPDLVDERTKSALALVHQRFATNTFPTWDLAQPFRMIAHNGEINTVRGNINWMNARKHSMASKILGDDLNKIWPLIAEGQSDSASFDNALELLVAGGYPMSHAMMMLVPEAWADNPLIDDKRKAFYEYHAGIMEPWDGPATLAFTDGKQIGATLDRNGLRPARYLITKDDIVMMASEMGVLPFKEKDIIKKWRLQPGKMFLVDMEQGKIIDDADLKEELCSNQDYQAMLDHCQIRIEDIDVKSLEHDEFDQDTLLNKQQAFGYSQEDIKTLLTPMMLNGMEGTGSMGDDKALAVLSNKAKPLFNYFRQNFAQVTNPPIDPIREEIVMSLISMVGPKPNLLALEEDKILKRLEVKQPILSNLDMQKIRDIDVSTGDSFRTKTLSICYPAQLSTLGMEQAIEDLCKAAEDTVLSGFNILILSDKDMDKSRIAIPALLATSAVHQHLIRKGLRTESGLVVETGAAREIHHFACLAGYGAEAINPYLAFETLRKIQKQHTDTLTWPVAKNNYIKAIGKGLHKVMSKMGISTYQSYCGAQIFDALGLSSKFIAKYFTGTPTLVEGAGLSAIAKEAVNWHKHAYGDIAIYDKALDIGGDYAYRVRGDNHSWTPTSISNLQQATRSKSQEKYDAFAKEINEQNKNLLTFRGLFEFNYADKPLDLSEVESAESIVTRFATGAMSYGSISWEAHTTLAVAMNAIGGKSNTGEGGEDVSRFTPMEDGSNMRSAIKQVASGRFGVTAEYLANSDMIQIKMAQGAKPGEGGQLPGHKVDKTIATVRHSTEGVGLISPPPHHDIYSIEDLAQLIHDLKNTQPKADISVKLVSEVGVGTVAAGVAKAHADHITISGADGGTGASPLTSIKHAGSVWELGLAETHQTLVLNKLRGRINLQVDGGLRTGRDVVVGALLGADEFGFATAPLIVEGCVMMRKCHLNTCPVGIATQNPELRKRFTGKPEHVINYFFFIAEEIRGIMAKLGYKTFSEMVGQSQRLNQRKAIDHYKAKDLDFSAILYKPDAQGEPIFHCEKQNHGLENNIDTTLIKKAKEAIENQNPVVIHINIHNYNRSFGTKLSGTIAKKYGHKGLAENSIVINAKGTAGQSLGAWLAAGITINLQGEGNDYVAKGLSGGRISIRPAEDSPLVAEDNIIVGNTVLFGAISGECYFNGVAGERFAVRNSGATAVVEGIGDHGCEYMTGGTIVILGKTGRNFAAGMSGGIAYIYDQDNQFNPLCNKAIVDLEKIEAGGEQHPQGNSLEALKSDMTKYDEQRLKLIISRHLQYTNSNVAKKILANWDKSLSKFIKVMPVDYRRALLEKQAKEAQQTASTGGQ